MMHVLQMRSDALTPMTFGGNGLGWLFSCTDCKDATVIWQR